ncbi:hypothetical protein D3C84_1202840 [compost metagenome]
MDIPYCCGAEMKATKRSDQPLYADDVYDLQVPVYVCTQCGNTLDSQFGVIEEKNEP